MNNDATRTGVPTPQADHGPHPPDAPADPLDPALADHRQRELSHRLAAQAALLDLVLSSIGDFAYIFDLHGRFAFVNKPLLDLWGLTLDQAVGKNFFDLGYPPDLAAKLQRQIQQVIDTRQRVVDETPYTNPAGEEGFYQYMFTPVISDHGQVSAVAGSTRDLTEHKRIEEQAREELRAADRRKDEFLATLAHELRNPMAPLRNALEIMKRSNADPATLEDARATMDRQISHMVRLIDDLLDVSRITRDKLSLQTESVEISAIVQQAVAACHTAVNSAHHILTVTLPEKPVWLDADPVRLTQILGNLINNACKYTPHGGRISLTVETDGPQLLIRVRDTGVGIPPDMLSRVFDMFTQVQSSTSLSQGGLGIGLSLVKRLVELHGGSVSAASDGLGAGSEFTLRLPIRSERTASPVLSAATPRPPADARRILVVDDNVDAARSLTRLLALDGHAVDAVHDGHDAIHAAAAHPYQVILLDIGLPNMNGYDVCRAIRSQPGGQDIVIAALTGWGQDDDRRKSRDAGFDDHLVKPVNFTQLRGILSKKSPAPSDA